MASDRLSEAEVIQRAREGDRTVFEYLYRLHSRRVYAVCLRMVGDPTEAEDLTQEAFLLLFRKNSHVSWRIGLLYLAAQAGG
jgi:RNA polymerase sigma-70 factor (ECF subfamily)